MVFTEGGEGGVSVAGNGRNEFALPACMHTYIPFIRPGALPVRKSAGTGTGTGNGSVGRLAWDSAAAFGHGNGNGTGLVPTCTSNLA
jgi:hypothetical protein